VSSARERAIAWRHAQHARVCRRTERWPHGTVVRAPNVPTYFEYNLARLEGPDPGVDAGALIAAAEEPLHDLGHRRIEVEDEQAGARLRPQFTELGWLTERLVYLHRTLPGPEVSAPAGAELRVEGFEATRGLRTVWRGESIWGEGNEFSEVEELVAARHGTRAAVAYVDGESAAFAAFSSPVDGAAEVELVFCRPERRGGGLGGAVVAAALAAAREAGAGEAFIEADDEGPAKRLYERLGFRPVWRRHSFTLRPGGPER
jgi:GNAT superfamily N-acetyltransferase